MREARKSSAPSFPGTFDGARGDCDPLARGGLTTEGGAYDPSRQSLADKGGVSIVCLEGPNMIFRLWRGYVIKKADQSNLTAPKLLTAP